MIIVATPTATTYSGYVILAASNVNPTIESLSNIRRFYPFGLVINQAFDSTNNTTQLALSDVADPYATNYPLVDRLNKNITGEELISYAGKRRCISCVYDNLFKVIRVNGCICPVSLTVPTTTEPTP
jgi:hypothetical protein